MSGLFSGVLCAIRGEGIKMAFPELLFLAFIVLKLCGVIDWSWWWVLSPFWIVLVFVII